MIIFYHTKFYKHFFILLLMKKKVKKFLVLSLLGLLVVNITFISAVYVITKYGTFNLNPGEKYTINIPFIGLSKAPTICGIAKTTSGDPMKDVNVSVYLDGTGDNDEFIAKETTDSKGGYCITLPEINKKTKYFVMVEYDNQTSQSDVQLGSNDYDFNFDEDKTYSKSSDTFVTLSGSIENEDAIIEDGRVEVNLRWYPNSSSDELIFDYQKYYLNIDAGETYEFPSDEFNVNWTIPSDAKTGTYKFLYRASFNGKEKAPTAGVLFTLTE